MTVTRQDGGLVAAARSRRDRGVMGWAQRLPKAWIATPRRRRLLHIGFCAPGFGLIFSTPLHGQLALSVLGGALFALPLGLRALTEPAFLKAEGRPSSSRPHIPAEAKPHA